MNAHARNLSRFASLLAAMLVLVSACASPVALQPTEPVVVVVGSEGKGLSRLVRETCDRVVSIPMASTVESLNAGVAASVALYEIARQRAATPRRSR